MSRTTDAKTMIQAAPAITDDDDDDGDDSNDDENDKNDDDDWTCLQELQTTPELIQCFRVVTRPLPRVTTNEKPSRGAILTLLYPAELSNGSDLAHTAGRGRSSIARPRGECGGQTSAACLTSGIGRAVLAHSYLPGASRATSRGFLAPLQCR